METMIGIAALLVGLGVAWLCFAVGVYFFTRTGREGLRIQRMEEERRHHTRRLDWRDARVSPTCRHAQASSVAR